MGSPHKTIVGMIEAHRSQDHDGVLDFYADDVVITVEFAIPNKITINGKEELRKLLHGRPPRRMYDDVSVANLDIVATSDPELFFVQWDYISRIGGTEIVNNNAILVRVRDDLVVSSRDYHNHVLRAVADGTVPGLLKAIEGMALERDRRSDPA